MPQSSLCQAHSALLTTFWYLLCVRICTSMLESATIQRYFIICRRMFAELEITYALVEQQPVTTLVRTNPALLCGSYSGLTESLTGSTFAEACPHMYCVPPNITRKSYSKQTAQTLRDVRFVNRFISICSFKWIYHIILRRCFWIIHDNAQSNTNYLLNCIRWPWIMRAAVNRGNGQARRFTLTVSTYCRLEIPA